MGNGELLREILCAGGRHGTVDGKIKGEGGVTDEPKFRQSYAPCLKHCKSCVGDDACCRPADERKNDCSFVGSRAVGRPSPA